MAAAYKRKKLLVDVPYQIRLIVRFAVLVIAISAVIGTGIFLLTQTSTTVAIENTRIYAKPTSDFILPVLFITVTTVALVGAAGIMAMMLIITHRIVGPVYRLKREIESMRMGNLKRNFSTREKDHLKDLARCLQDMSDVLYDRHHNLKKSHESLARFLAREGAGLDAAQRQQLNKILAELQNNIDFFKT